MKRNLASYSYFIQSEDKVIPTDEINKLTVSNICRHCILDNYTCGEWKLDCLYTVLNSIYEQDEMIESIR